MEKTTISKLFKEAAKLLRSEFEYIRDSNPHAAEKGADLLITGDVGHHHALEAESIGIALIDAGHFNTEKVAFRCFAEHLMGLANDLGWEIEIETDEEESDPLQNGY